VSLAHPFGHVADFPSQMYGTHETLFPVLPAALTVHTPGVALQDSQAPSHAESQQRPSTQKPLSHAAADPQLLPATVTHAPLALQVEAPVQLSGSLAETTELQVPGTRAQVSQTPLHGRSQQ
jgi:hypothetical protein